MEILDQILALLGSLGPEVLATVAIVLEFALRLVPSDKPKSILHLIGAVARKVGEALVKIADILDKVLPQKLK